MPAKCGSTQNRKGQGESLFIFSRGGANLCSVFAWLCMSVQCLAAGWSEIGSSPSDRKLSKYFAFETAKLRDRCLAGVETLKEWKEKRVVYRRQLFEMLGLDPLPPKTDLKPVVTGAEEHDSFKVEKIHYQSRPGLYVTANLYIPKGLKEPAPAVLYVCGHGRIKKDGVSYGNKARYQHHPGWFARHGYVCFILDTLQLGEIEGIHHGTYSHNMWWWNCRGYAPAGVEAWNCIRALDYLETRKEVDGTRIGVTGRSGGGAYSWWISALDDRIKAAVPVAGITDLENHVVDGCVEGHCDCMYLVNTYRWDYPLVAALVAPRPLLISNSDKDRIFPLEGVLRLHKKVRKIYRLYGAEDKLGLNITEGPHRDTQPLRIHAFTWFNRFLKDKNPLIDKPAVPFFKPEQLRVFRELPEDRINAEIHESFVPKASVPSAPESRNEWVKMRGRWLEVLLEKSFGGWPEKHEADSFNLKRRFDFKRHGIRLTALDFTSQNHVRLRFYLVQGLGRKEAERCVLTVFDQKGWNKWASVIGAGFEEVGNPEKGKPDAEAFESYRERIANGNQITAYLAPRGIGPVAWNPDKRKRTHIRRRFMLLGQTLDGMRVWDVRRAIQLLRSLDRTKKLQVVIRGRGRMAGVVVYASLFEQDLAGLELSALPRSHREGPFFLNVLRFLDIPQALAMAAERTRVTVHQKRKLRWNFPRKVAESLNWPENRFRVVCESEN